MTVRSKRLSGLLAGILLHICVPVSADDSLWWSGFCPPGIEGEAYAVAERSGSIYVGGEFDRAGGVEVSNIARWDGNNWHALGGGVSGRVNCILSRVEDIVVGGRFVTADGNQVNYIARYEAGVWYSLDDGLGYEVMTLISNNGVLFAGGDFYKEVDGINDIRLVSRWDGFNWVTVGTSILYDELVGFGSVNALAHFNGELVAAGRFDHCGSAWTNHIASYDNVNWNPIEGTDGISWHVSSLEPWGNELYIGGYFAQADGIDTFGLARLTSGGNFAAVADGGTPNDEIVYCLASELGGYLAVGTNDGVQKYTVAPGEWAGEIGDLDPAVGIRDVAFGGGKLYAASSFFWEGSYRDAIGVWDQDDWQRMGAGLASRPLGDSGEWSDMVYELADYQGDIVAVGNFNVEPIDNELPTCWNVGLFDGKYWHPLGTGLSTNIYTAIEHDGEIVIGGNFGWDIAVRGRIARFDGAAWSVLAADVGFAGGDVYDLVHFGDDLIACGQFTSVDWNPVNRIARWDGVAWHSLGEGFNNRAKAMVVFDGDLYVVGNFDEAGGIPVSGVARWDGVSWSAVGPGTGINDDAYSEVHSIGVHQGELLMGGSFIAVDGNPVPHLAVFRGGEWLPFAGGVTAIEAHTTVHAIKSTDVGLFIGGRFTEVAGMAANCVARWTGSAWETLGSGVSEGQSYTEVRSLLVHDGNLYLGGRFAKAGNQISVSLARWREDMVPTLLAHFTLHADPPAVEIAWESEAAASGFALSALLAGETWAVDFTMDSPGSFRARDENSALTAGGIVEYRLEHDGQLLRSASVTITPLARPRLLAHPNPFNPQVTLRVDLPRAGLASLRVYDPGGRLVSTIFAGEMPAGSADWIWDGRDDRGRSMPSGVYLARIADGRGSASRKLLMLR